MFVKRLTLERRTAALCLQCRELHGDGRCSWLDKFHKCVHMAFAPRLQGECVQLAQWHSIGLLCIQHSDNCGASPPVRWVKYTVFPLWLSTFLPNFQGHFLPQVEQESAHQVANQRVHETLVGRAWLHSTLVESCNLRKPSQVILE